MLTCVASHRGIFRMLAVVYSCMRTIDQLLFTSPARHIIHYYRSWTGPKPSSWESHSICVQCKVDTMQPQGHYLYSHPQVCAFTIILDNKTCTARIVYTWNGPTFPSYALNLEKPSCLHTTEASSAPQISSHTVPQALFLQISTLPLPITLPCNLTEPAMQTAADKDRLKPNHYSSLLHFLRGGKHRTAASSKWLQFSSAS